MANSPQKTDDPMADTLNAIEAALKLGDGDSDKAPAVKSPAEGNGAENAGSAGTAGTAGTAGQETLPELAVEEPLANWQADETPPRPANDDRANMGAMLQAGLDLTPILTHSFSIEDYQKGFDIMRSGQSGKVILEW